MKISSLVLLLSLAQPLAAQMKMPDGHAGLDITPMRQQMIGVKTGFVEKKELFKDIEASGRLAFDPELYTAQTEYAEALQQLQKVKDSPLPEVKRSAKRMMQSAKLRLKILGLSDKQIARIAPGQSGEAGLLINQPGGKVWVYADIFEMDLPYVKVGQSADVSSGFSDGQELKGKVVSVDRVIGSETRTAKARILVGEGAQYLRPGAYVNVTIHAPLGEQTVIPSDAVMDTGKQAWAFTVSGQGMIMPTLIHIKAHAGDEVALTDGLKPGQKIVTSATFLIDSESRLKAVTSSDKTPACPKGQHWDLSMAMCMPD